jgi:catechol 2,3-dioxygenase-like lactoylglutathione lyase family enzyme
MPLQNTEGHFYVIKLKQAVKRTFRLLQGKTMKLHKIDHVGIIVNDLPAATAFFLDLGLEMQGKAELEGEWLGKAIGLKDVKTELVMLTFPDGGANLELAKFLTPSDANGIQPSFANSLGIRHICIAVDDIEGIVAKMKQKGMELIGEIYNYENTYKTCYCRGPEGIIVELAEKIE